ncbi:sortase-like acyltransferase [Xenococcus sp. PCC 7305]|uniref:GNAT family N-acetyltransferase n=1 Tax=Xenococcus sp. PCC 7305 TaxID=102125 RepID=UPI0002AC8B4A|nr:GNAT family N-acetyltransferase [Xenococcus sp. PCC 7305]ELS03243.1 sortase-like acyltransferase [Xenococcus sp. PCC 7305]
MKIRNYLPTDFQEIADIYNQAIALGGITMDIHPYTAQDIGAIAAKFNRRETILVAEQDTQVIGWGIIKRYSDRPGYLICCETSIYLSFASTGQGYGHSLQHALLEKVQAFGYHHVVAKILATNPQSIKFHQRFGFEIVGIQKEIGYCQGKWLDVAIMQLVFPHITPQVGK